MSTTDHDDYDYAFEIVQKLPPEQRERLAQSVLAGKSREEIEKKRQELIRLSLECPTATEDEIRELEDNMKNFRKEFNESFRRRLG